MFYIPLIIMYAKCILCAAIEFRSRNIVHMHTENVLLNIVCVDLYQNELDI